MTKLSTLILLITSLTTFSSCFLFSKHNDYDYQIDMIGNWVRRSDFNGIARSESVSFVVGDSAYIATGYDGTNRLGDVWRYDVDNNYWIQKASLPAGAERNSAVAFGTSTKAYITTGYNGAVKLKDTWEYDPAQNTWTKKADFGGTARLDAVGFAINDKGYVSTGSDGADKNDTWLYDPSADTWTQKKDTAVTARAAAVVFVYKNQAYVVTGLHNNVPVNDMWMYDPTTDKWTQKRSITNVSTDTYDDQYGTTLIVRSNAASFVISDHGYVCTGENGSILKTVWEYDFANDAWNQKTPWEGLERTGAVGFAAKNRGFVSCGRNTTYEFDDTREFFPTAAYDVND